MNVSFYTAAVGAREQQSHLDVVANNISNVNTTGFKAERASFSSLMYQNMLGIDEEELPRGVGAQMIAATTDFSSGALMSTFGAQDYAIQGEGFFALLDGTTGEVSYTRDGSFTAGGLQEATGETDEFGFPVYEQKLYLTDGSGRFVLSRYGQMIEVTDINAEYPVGVFDFVNTDGMRHVGGNRFVPVEKNGQVRVGTGTAIHKMLEGSNVDLADEISKMIEAQRMYSYALRMVSVSEEVENTVNNLRN
ncbi:MAG: flagellar hook basal-body protein [Oscillospiraceae bacterium]|nr:flagellar hook basal-body protein [Oscillospiraceae bacterium]